MGRPLDLDSALSKFEWAQHHVELLKLDVAAWGQAHGGAITLRREVNAQGGYVSYRVEGVKPPRASFGLGAGDAVNNFRSALDHLAQAIVAVGRDPNPRRPESVCFPIVTGRRADFDTKARTQLPGVSRRLLNFVSSCQPYEGRWHGYWSLDLAPLAELARRDKHRHLLTTVVRHQGYKATYPRGAKLRRWYPPGASGPLEPNTELVRLYVQPWGAHPEVRVDLDPAEQIVLEGDWWMFGILQSMEATVAQVFERVQRL